MVRSMILDVYKRQPLKQAEDAVLVDTSDMTIEQVIDRIVELIG